jgi:hypothetical protein
MSTLLCSIWRAILKTLWSQWRSLVKVYNSMIDLFEPQCWWPPPCIVLGNPDHFTLKRCTSRFRIPTCCLHRRSPWSRHLNPCTLNICTSRHPLTSARRALRSVFLIWSKYGINKHHKLLRASHPALGHAGKHRMSQCSKQQIPYSLLLFCVASSFLSFWCVPTKVPVG